MTRLIRFHYHRPGKPTLVRDQLLVLDRPDAHVLFTEGYEGRDITIGETPVLQRGAPIIWYLFPDCWHDVGRFHLADGTFTGWYTDLCTPLTRRGPDWSSTDLFLDFWLPASGPAIWLDQDEFAVAVEAGAMDRPTVAQALRERERITALHGAGNWPPPVARLIDLEWVRTKESRPSQ